MLIDQNTHKIRNIWQSGSVLFW